MSVRLYPSLRVRSMGSLAVQLPAVATRCCRCRRIPVQIHLIMNKLADSEARWVIRADDCKFVIINVNIFYLKLSEFFEAISLMII
ncbi:hypothetical protein SAMN04488144_1225 [Methylobacterium sp. 190mf]|nr:hypothetical protein SAMN04488144_1225 [Methylobacterium sp. 190mf]